MPTRIATRVTDAVHYVVRSEGRLRARLATRLRREGAADAHFTLLNMSASGFMGECAETVRVGSRVVLLLPLGGAVEADVRWALRGRIGCQLRGRFTRRQRALVLALTLKNGLMGWTGVKALVLAAMVAVLALR